MQIRTGWLRFKMPLVRWDQISLHESFALGQSPEHWIKNFTKIWYIGSEERKKRAKIIRKRANIQHTIAVANKVTEGEFNYFSKHSFQLGFPPDWFLNPFEQISFPRDKHWSQISDFSRGDIKCVWELNRFTFVFSLVRAYILTNDARYPESFWHLVNDWVENNPPNSGPNWKCGQEISFRIMALCFGLFYFIDHPQSTPKNLSKILRIIIASGNRIEKNISYAVSQKNNHGMSEAMGLWTIGCLFPELKSAKRWRKKGGRLLEKLGLELIDEDGGFSQHSVFYHRLMLQVYFWVFYIADKINVSFSDRLISRIQSAIHLAFELQDEETGALPYLGQNDGNDLLPLSSCEYQDFRPILQSFYLLLNNNGLYVPGPWDEMHVLFFGVTFYQTGIQPLKRQDIFIKNSGCFVLHGQKSRAFLHAPEKFRHRPAQADLLHIDIGYNHQRIAVDPGTYSYNSPVPWNNPLAGTAFHNTLCVDGLDQMERFGKFLWLPWPHCHITTNGVSEQKNIHLLSAFHDGYTRLKDPVYHSRTIVRLPDDVWMILDRGKALNKHYYQLHWLFQDCDYEWSHPRLSMKHEDFQVNCISDTLFNGNQQEIIRADKTSPRGWISPFYMDKQPAISLDTVLESDDVLFYTIFDMDSGVLKKNQNRLIYQRTTWELIFEYSDTGRMQLKLSGSIQDTIEWK